MALEVEQNILAGSATAAHFSYIEQMRKNYEFIKSVDQSVPLTDVLRLICLYSLTNNGVKPKLLDVFKSDLLSVRLIY